MGNEQTWLTKISNQILITMQEKLKNLQNKCFVIYKMPKKWTVYANNDKKTMIISIIIHEKSRKLNFSHSKLLKIRI